MWFLKPTFGLFNKDEPNVSDYCPKIMISAEVYYSPKTMISAEVKFYLA